MLPRFAQSALSASLAREAAVALLGPRQVGKTTLALALAEGRSAVYLDLESSRDRDKLSDPPSYLQLHADKLVILDEIHRLPELFASLRGIIDAGRRAGQGLGRFLLLGSASIDLMRQSETLAGRIEYLELTPLSLAELPSRHSTDELWLRGGFPRSLLAPDPTTSLIWRQNFIRTYLERDIPQFGPRIPAESLMRLWTMLAHHQGGLLNAAQLARNLGVSGHTVAGYVDLLVDLLLMRRLPPWVGNVGKRLVKSPKVYIRDSGLTHALLGIASLEDLLGHPIVGASFEGFAIENLLAASPPGTQASFYRSARGAEIDLILDLGPRQGVWAIEIKRSAAAKTAKGFNLALEDVQPRRALVVHAGEDRYPKSAAVEVIGLRELSQELRSFAP